MANVAAGSLVDGGLTPDALRSRLDAAGLTVVPEPRPDAPLPERLAAAAELPGIDAVAVAGGDGTLACAAQALTGREVPLGILPLGTMNLLAKDLGLPLDLDAAIAVLATGPMRAIDAGEVNGHVFLINSVLGLPPGWPATARPSAGGWASPTSCAWEPASCAISGATRGSAPS